MTNSTSPDRSTPAAFAALREAVLKVAILGTGRQSLDAAKIAGGAAEDDSLSQLLAQLDLSDRENSVLSAAALLHFYERAGAMPAISGDSLPQMCVADELPRCNAAASTRLAALLEQTESPMFAEWLRVAAAFGLRAPEEYLPELLDAGKQSRELRPLIGAVIGRRGHWLAAQNPAWSYGVAVSDEQTQSDEIWQTGTKAERFAFLKYWRERDASKARELLASTWKQEPSDERARFIEAFEISLSIADEEFLENALDDKRKEVRKTAAEFLAQLPESRLVARNFERLKNILTFAATSKLKKLIGRGAVIEVALPKEFDKAMARDGIAEKWHSGGKHGEKAGWVQQMIGAVPPTFWEREWNLSPREIIQAASASDWREVLLNGFVSAAVRHKDYEWLETLSEVLLEAQHNLYTRALLALPAEKLESFVVQNLNNGFLKSSSDSGLSSIVHFHKATWGVEFSRMLLDFAREQIRKDDAPEHWLRYSLKNWAFWIPPELYEEAASGWPTENAHWEQWESVVNEFLGVLQARCDMLRELDESKHQ